MTKGEADDALLSSLELHTASEVIVDIMIDELVELSIEDKERTVDDGVTVEEELSLLDWLAEDVVMMEEVRACDELEARELDGLAVPSLSLQTLTKVLIYGAEVSLSWKIAL